MLGSFPLGAAPLGGDVASGLAGSVIATLGALTLSSDVDAGKIATVAATFADLICVADVQSGVSGDVTATLDSLVLNSVLDAGLVATVSTSFEDMTGTGFGALQLFGSLAKTLDSMTLASEMYINVKVASLVQTLQSLTLQSELKDTAVLSLTGTFGPLLGHSQGYNLLIDEDMKAMTPIRLIITDAMRESRLIPVGASPEAEEYEEALRLLNNTITSLFGFELGEELIDTEYEGTDKFPCGYAPANTRLFMNATEATTIKLNPKPQDGERFSLCGTMAPYLVVIDGNGRKISGSASVGFLGAQVSVEWFYRADLGQWVRIDPLGDSDMSPFAQEFDDLLITLLSMRLNPRYGKEMSPDSGRQLRRSLTKFSARYCQHKRVGSETNLRNINPWYDGFSSDNTFNKGYRW